MAKLNLCDVCQKPAVIRAKLFMTDLEKSPQVRSNAHHANYHFHLDVGECCYDRVLKVFNWRARMTRKEYAESRKRK